VIAFFDNVQDVRKNLSIIHAVDGQGNSIGWFDNKMRGTEASGDRAYANDIIVYRHAEMIFFKAEAYAALNNTPQAITSLLGKSTDEGNLNRDFALMAVVVLVMLVVQVCFLRPKTVDMKDDV